jgi:hypothetical protein
MPLITLLLYYSLDRLSRENEHSEFRPTAQATSASADDSR